MRRLLPLVLVLLLVRPAFGERLVMDEARMKALDPGGQVELRNLLPDGSLLFLSQHTGGEPARIIRVDAATGRVRTTPLGFAQVQYFQVNDTDTAALAWEAPAGRLWRVDLATGQAALVSEKRKGRQSFGLYGDGRSRILPLGDDFAAWGYFLGKKGNFEADYLVRIHGTKIVKLLPRKALTDAATNVWPLTRALAEMHLVDGYLACLGRAPRSYTGLLALRLRDRAVVCREPLQAFGGMALRGATLCAVQIDGAPPARLVACNLATKKCRVLGRGRFLNPAISVDGRTVSVLRVAPGKGHGIEQELVLIPLADGAARTIPLSDRHLYLDQRWCKDGSILLFDGQAVWTARATPSPASRQSALPDAPR